MNEHDRNELLAALVERPQDRARTLHQAGLSSQERDELTAMAETADAVWHAAHGAPALADDPVAAMLGLVPDAECALDSRKLATARKRARLKVSDLAARLRERGWSVTEPEIFRWETRSAREVAPAMVQAVAEILGASIDALIIDPSLVTETNRFAELRNDPRFEQLVQRWALAQNVARAVAAAALESRMASTVHRGAVPDADKMLRSLEALVASVESPRDR